MVYDKMAQPKEVHVIEECLYTGCRTADGGIAPYFDLPGQGTASWVVVAADCIRPTDYSCLIGIGKGCLIGEVIDLQHRQAHQPVNTDGDLAARGPIATNTDPNTIIVIIGVIGERPGRTPVDGRWDWELAILWHIGDDVAGQECDARDGKSCGLGWSIHCGHYFAPASDVETALIISKRVG